MITMATRVEEKLVDDLDGTEAAETVAFGLDAGYYAIDLSKDNAKELRALLKPYIRKATATAPPTPALEAKQIRVWAKENGYEIADRGRIHHNIVEAYREAQR